MNSSYHLTLQGHGLRKPVKRINYIVQHRKNICLTTLSPFKKCLSYF